ncbi:hypothetical protein FBQ90_00195 [Betaproteobacteria bacterium PRO5]|nr:hypothetical protein [Betaproteobacteria bacterium PRO5]
MDIRPIRTDTDYRSAVGISVGSCFDADPLGQYALDVDRESRCQHGQGIVGVPQREAAEHAQTSHFRGYTQIPAAITAQFLHDIVQCHIQATSTPRLQASRALSADSTAAEASVVKRVCCPAWMRDGVPAAGVISTLP